MIQSRSCWSPNDWRSDGSYSILPLATELQQPWLWAAERTSIWRSDRSNRLKTISFPRKLVEKCESCPAIFMPACGVAATTLLRPRWLSEGPRRRRHEDGFPFEIISTKIDWEIPFVFLNLRSKSPTIIMPVARWGPYCENDSGEGLTTIQSKICLKIDPIVPAYSGLVFLTIPRGRQQEAATLFAGACTMNLSSRHDFVFISESSFWCCLELCLALGYCLPQRGHWRPQHLLGFRFPNLLMTILVKFVELTSTIWGWWRRKQFLLSWSLVPCSV